YADGQHRPDVPRFIDDADRGLVTVAIRSKPPSVVALAGGKFRSWTLGDTRAGDVWPAPHTVRGSAHFSPDGALLAVGGGRDSRDSGWLWDLQSNHDLGALLDGGYRGVAPVGGLVYSFNPDGRMITATGADAETFHVFDVATRKPTTPPMIQTPDRV